MNSVRDVCEPSITIFHSFIPNYETLRESLYIDSNTAVAMTIILAYITRHLLSIFIIPLFDFFVTAIINLVIIMIFITVLVNSQY